jgi:hypothetical protein
MRILLGHALPDRASFGSKWVEDWLARIRCAGIEVHPFSLVFNPKRPVTCFKELDLLWRFGNRQLLGMYERLAKASTDFDVFICYNGSNVHPEFVRQLKCFTVYGCFDDPESSEDLSKPVAATFDMALVGNIAEIDAYKSWGVRQVRWWPLGFRQDDYSPALTEQRIIAGIRDVEVTLLCERVSKWRRKRVDKFVGAFPAGAYYGHGWPSGFLPESHRVPLLQRTRIGINVHNSTGPINFRTFYLPANGVMQICDNKSHLGKIFSLGEEVVGYDSMEEAIELTRYYLDHDDERRRIAAAGWRRATRDYNEIACFRRVVAEISAVRPAEVRRAQGFSIEVGAARPNIFWDCVALCGFAVHLLRRIFYGVMRKIETALSGPGICGQ